MIWGSDNALLWKGNKWRSLKVENHLYWIHVKRYLQQIGVQDFSWMYAWRDRWPKQPYRLKSSTNTTLPSSHARKQRNRWFSPKSQERKPSVVAFSPRATRKAKIYPEDKSGLDTGLDRSIVFAAFSHLLYLPSSERFFCSANSLRCYGFDWAQRRNCQRSYSSHFCRKDNQPSYFSSTVSVGRKKKAADRSSRPPLR